MSLLHDIIHELQSQQAAFLLFVKNSFRNTAFPNVYISVLVAYSIGLFMEVILPKQRKHGVFSRKNFWLDTFYVVFNDLIIYVLGFFALCAVTEFVFLKALGVFGIQTLKVVDITSWNPLIQVITMFIIQDFCEFCAHFLLHRSDFLWKFHKIHHAQEELGAASTRHFHFLEMCIFKPIIYLPFAMVGYSVMDYFLFQITVQNFWGFFTHCNIKVKWGFLNYIINTPETHAWHHAKNIPGRYGVNYASILNIWDLIFGYFYLPKDLKPTLGVEKNDVPKNFIGQLIYPFKSSPK